MTASLKFYESLTPQKVEATAESAKFIVYTDGGNNEYILDFDSNTFKYKASGSNNPSEVTGFKTMIESYTSALSDYAKAADVYTKTDANNTFAKAADLNNKADKTSLNDYAKTADVYTKTKADSTFAKVDGTNVTAGNVEAMLGKLTGDDVVITKSVLDANTTFAKAADLNNKADKTSLNDYAKTADVYTKTKADSTFAKVDGTNVTAGNVEAMLGKLTGNKAVITKSDLDANTTFAKAADVYTKTDANTTFAKAVDLNNKADKTSLNDYAKTEDVYTKINADSTFAKADGSNANAEGVEKMLKMLTGNKAVITKSDLGANNTSTGDSNNKQPSVDINTLNPDDVMPDSITNLI
ncbi:MAG: hypothetical protein QWI36_00075 [Wolbachia endosymbiont of Tyrophagus putrescentiae]|nr:hypothetical protein [Wolbachia endosymbiont of Tyrophagus putrescentiae]